MDIHIHIGEQEAHNGGKNTGNNTGPEGIPECFPEAGHIQHPLKGSGGESAGLLIQYAVDEKVNQGIQHKQ